MEPDETKSGKDPIRLEYDARNPGNDSEDRLGCVILGCYAIQFISAFYFVLLVFSGAWIYLAAPLTIIAIPSWIGGVVHISTMLRRQNAKRKYLWLLIVLQLLPVFGLIMVVLKYF